MVLIKLEELQDSDLTNIVFDFARSDLKLQFRLLDNSSFSVSLVGLVSLSYRPDFADEPPWICLEFSVQSLATLDELRQGELLYSPNSLVKDDIKFPLHRVKAASGDFELVAVCHQIKENPL